MNSVDYMEDITRKDLGNEIQYNFYTPAGEDFGFTIPKTDDEQHELYKFAEEFDIDEHVELLVPNRGKNGIPSSVGELVEDAEWIKDRLLVLAEEIKDEMGNEV